MKVDFAGSVQFHFLWDAGDQSLQVVRVHVAGLEHSIYPITVEVAYAALAASCLQFTDGFAAQCAECQQPGYIYYRAVAGGAHMSKDIFVRKSKPGDAVEIAEIDKMPPHLRVQMEVLMPIGVRPGEAALSK